VRTLWIDEMDRRPVAIVPEKVAQVRLTPLLEADARFAGFTLNAKRVHVRARSAGGFEVVCLQALKGAQFVLKWGLSLPYVPDGWWTSKVRWHRDAKNAHFDLFERCQREEHHEFGVDGLHGTVAFEASLERAWRGLRDQIASWFSRAVTDEGAVQITCEEFAPTGFRGCAPPREVVRAFIYAHHGQAEEAMRALDRFDTSPEDAAALRKALARVLSERH
jgi:hypothetical protein